MYETGPDGKTRATGLKLSKAGEEMIVQADAYVAALDVPGAKRLIPQVRSPACLPFVALWSCWLGRNGAEPRPGRLGAALLVFLAWLRRAVLPRAACRLARAPALAAPWLLRSAPLACLRRCTGRSVNACKYRTSKPEPAWDDT